MKLTLLGCGTSSGVPRIGNDWGDCDPGEPKNRRTRVSILVETEETRILVDTSPDLREQLLANDISDIDAVIWTHDHADHCHGIDDLRQIFHRRRQPVNGYGRTQTISSLKSRFGYVFQGNVGYPSIVDDHILEDDMQIGDIVVRCVDQPHGPITSTGLRFEKNNKSICYATDFSQATSAMIKLYEECDVMVIDALREMPHPTHAHLDMSLEALTEIRPKHAILTHMDKSMDYMSLEAMLPTGVHAGYDGLKMIL